MVKPLRVWASLYNISGRWLVSFHLNIPSTGLSYFICVPPKFICQSPNPIVAVFRVEAAEEAVKVKWDHKGGALLG